MRPTPLRFEQYLDLCPEAKFELVSGQPLIGGWEGTRNVLGLLLMTFGLTEVVQLLHPSAWVAALPAEEAAQLHDAGRRDAWWDSARQAAALLHERFGVTRTAVIGDLIATAPLHYWSELTLVVWGLPKDAHDIYTTLDALASEPQITLRRAEDASERQRAAFDEHAVDIRF